MYIYKKLNVMIFNFPFEKLGVPTNFQNKLQKYCTNFKK